VECVRGYILLLKKCAVSVIFFRKSRFHKSTKVFLVAKIVFAEEKIWNNMDGVNVFFSMKYMMM